MCYILKGTILKAINNEREAIKVFSKAGDIIAQIGDTRIST